MQTEPGQEPAPDPPAEVEALRSELEALRVRAEAAERDSVLRKALGEAAWFEPEDSYRVLSERAERSSDGAWRVALAEGDGKPGAWLSPAEAVRELARRKPHWVRARVTAGTGAGAGEATGGGGARGPLTYAELLKPENAARLREFVHDRPQELERLRSAYFGA
ncbi:MAG: hypothetical protein HS116_10115 [Planctomycetes bacterium]|nr:hypothetical protein [Planctomycetota bacterium]